MAGTLRDWQTAALRHYRDTQPRDFLVVATPGAGKTTFALHAAAHLFRSGQVAQLVVVTPTEHLKGQWADAAAALGLPIDPQFSNADGRTSPEFAGIAVTYAQVAAAPDVHAAGVAAVPTLVILDEVHHAGLDLSWGDAVRQAYAGATRRLSLSGTPFRGDTNPISFIRYVPGGDGVLTSQPDFAYGYTDALADGVVRPVVFYAYTGQARWRTSAGDELTATLGAPMTKSATSQAWRTALDPKGEWVPAVLTAADLRLSQVRADGMPDAGGLVLASNRTHARAYARILAALTGEEPVLVTSDDPGASAKIDAFSAGRQRWLVAVRMVSEGVDVPRLACGVYAANVGSPLFFAQAIGRFVRARRTGETASVFLPAVQPLLRLAAELEAARDHRLTVAPGDGDEFLDDALLGAANRQRSTADLPVGEFAALEASAQLDQLIFGGDSFGTVADVGSRTEDHALALPGLLDLDEVRAALRGQAARSLAASAAQFDGAPEPVALPLHRKVAAARRELHRLVGAYHRRTGAGHGQIHARLRQACGGPATSEATLEQLHARANEISGW